MRGVCVCVFNVLCANDDYPQVPHDHDTIPLLSYHSVHSNKTVDDLKEKESKSKYYMRERRLLFGVIHSSSCNTKNMSLSKANEIEHTNIKGNVFTDFENLLAII
jgi:hypothetical protein